MAYTFGAAPAVLTESAWSPPDFTTPAVPAPVYVLKNPFSSTPAAPPAQSYPVVSPQPAVPITAANGFGVKPKEYGRMIYAGIAIIALGYVLIGRR